MKTRCLGTAMCLLVLTGAAAQAQDPGPPPGDPEPLLRLEPGAPTSLVTALAFSPDGRTLYAAGWDKVVRVWTLDARTNRFVLDDRDAYRVPIGPGLDGALNAMALSADGTWLAVAGSGVFRDAAEFRKPGWVLPAIGGMSEAMRRDVGTIWVFNTRTRGVRRLRGHLGPVVALAFAPVQEGQPPLLVSAAREWDPAAHANVGAVRLWAVTDRDRPELSGFGGLPDPYRSKRPGLAVWRPGQDPEHLRVAIAWGDGTLRLWDAAADQNRLWKVPDGYYNNILAFLPGPVKLISGSIIPDGSQLRFWDVPPGQGPQADSDRVVRFPLADHRFLYQPWALALVGSQTGGKPDQAAVVLSLPARGNEYWLHLIDLDPRNFAAVTARIPLWKGGLVNPVLAVAPGGRHLAVAGNPDHQIAVYSIPGLLQGQDQPQRLHSSGTTLRSVAFVSRGQDLGLVLSPAAKDRPGAPPREPRPDDLVLDFTRRSLAAGPDGWTTATARPGDWQVEPSAGEPDAQGRRRPFVAVRHGDQPEQRIWLKTDQSVITDWALLPPGPRRQVPILALASHDRGQPALGLYNAATGEQVRQLTGHTGLIRCLAFAADGRLLASAAEDQTVCVWSLTDLDQTLGRRGLLPGVAVNQEASGDLVVAKVDEASPSRVQEFHAGDVIEGIVAEGGLRRLASPLDFYDAISLLKPGQTVTLRIRDRHGRRDVPVPVGQGIDERKPLLSLFVTWDAGRRQWEWIGWNPLGPYESSSRGVERLLGWHFNTGKAQAPTAFALADQYRKAYYRPGLLAYLVWHGELTGLDDQRGPRNPRRPNMVVWIDPVEKIDGDGQALIRQGRGALNLAILDDFPPDQVEGVQWQVDDPKAAGEELRRTSDREWTGDLSRVPWERGVHQVRVVLRTHEAEFPEVLRVRYQPPPPRLTTRLPEDLEVDQPEFSVQAEVGPGAGTVQVRLIQRHENQELPATEWELHAPGVIRQPLTLRPGRNLIEVVARNQQALRGHEEDETTRLRRVVYYRVPSAPPDISIDSVVPLGPEPGPAVAIAGRPTIRVEAPQVRITGAIKAAGEKLVQAEWRLTGRAPAVLAGFAPQRHEEFPFHEELKLKPGSQELLLRARAAHSKPATARLTINYRPPVPQVELTAPADGLALSEGRDRPRVQLQARILAPRGRPGPYKAVVVINETERPDVPVRIDGPGGTVTAEVPVQPGDNQIRLRLSNPWTVGRPTEAVHVSYRRPPRIVAMDLSRAGAAPLAKVLARVISPPELPLVRAEINGHELPRDAIVAATAGPGVAAWTVVGRDVPLERGVNSIRLAVWNSDGRCLEPETRQIAYVPVPPPKPDIQILNPQEDSTVRAYQYAVEFQVRSPSPLKKVELVRGQQVVAGLDAAQIRKTGQGLFEVQHRQVVNLEPGPNDFHVVAVNGGGAQTVTVPTLSYVPPPVRVVIEELESRTKPGQVIKVPETNRVAMVPDGKVQLHGRVIWPDQRDQRLNQAAAVNVWVNGFLQVPTPLQPRAGSSLQRAFRAAILLNRRDNQIEVELPGLAQETGPRSALRVACRSPERGQRLHLLIVGVGEPDASKLRDEALQALGARRLSDDEFATSAFPRGRIYGPVCGTFVHCSQVHRQLRRIKAAIHPQSGSAGDVVMIYYQGGESVNAQGDFLLQTGGNTISGAYLAQFFDVLPGAHILLLDVTRRAARTGAAPLVQANPEMTRWSTDSHLGLLRAAWLVDCACPSDARLIEALRDTMPRARKLGEVVSEVSRKFRRLEQKYPPHSLIFQPDFPPPLLDLDVGTAN